MAYSRSLSNDEIKNRIQTILSKFVAGVEPDRLSDWLVQEYVITSDQWQRIHSDHPTRQSRCRALLHHLFSIPHPRAFEVVYQALAEESHYILESIDNQEPVTGIGFHPHKRILSQSHFDINGKPNEQLARDYENQKRLWEAEKFCLLKTQKELETKLSEDKSRIEQLEKDFANQRRTWETEKDRLHKIQKELETKPSEVKGDAVQNVATTVEKTSPLTRSDLSNKRIPPETRPKLNQKPPAIPPRKPPEHRCKSDTVLIQTIRLDSARKKKLWFKAAEEDKYIMGMTILNKELFVVSDKSSEIDVYDSKDFSFSRRWNLKELISPNDIASCDRNKCLYIINYKGYGKQNEILRVDTLGTLINSWSTGDDYGWGLSITDESNVILAVYTGNKLNEYSPDGHLIRNITLSLDNCDCYPMQALKLTSGHFVISQTYFSPGYVDDGHGGGDICKVCIVDAEGKLKKSFEVVCELWSEEMTYPVHLSVDANGFVMVADRENSRVLLLDQDLDFKGEILSKDRHGLRSPCKILLDEPNGLLLVADNERDNHRILIFHYC